MPLNSASRLARGSSRSRIRGCPTTARASATRCCSPPDNSWVAAHQVSDADRAQRLCHSFTRSRGGIFPRFQDELQVLPHREMGPERRSWKTKPIRLSCGARTIRRPALAGSFRSQISPLSGVSSPAMMRRSVVLPHPLGPRTTAHSPCGTRARRCRALDATQIVY